MSLFAPIRALVPAPWRPALRRAYTRVRHAGLRRRCNVCGCALRGFLAHGIPPEPDFLCPICGSKPPHRLAAIFFELHPALFARGRSLVHVAPEAGLGRRLRAQAQAAGMNYRSGDLGGTGDAHLDLRRLPFADGSVDLFYCCHVLNCMEEDRQAMREIHRVLHPSGLALLQVPAFERGPHTVETQGRDSRLATFGDDGIYRRYTNDDYHDRLREAGYRVEEFRAIDQPEALGVRHQLKREVLHLCRKP
jgi:SAM-dependent methyltransferase